jgi:hypothetical protein
VRQYLRALSPSVEFVIVIACACGLFIFRSTREVFQPSPQGHISEAHLEFLLMYEPAVLTGFVIFLGVRGWTPQRVGLWPSAKETLEPGEAVGADGAHADLVGSSGAGPTQQLVIEPRSGEALHVIVGVLRTKRMRAHTSHGGSRRMGAGNLNRHRRFLARRCDARIKGQRSIAPMFAVMSTG